MQEYLEAIKIKFTADEASYQVIQDKIKSFANDLNKEISNSTVKLELDSLKSVTDNFIFNGKKILDLSAEELLTIKESLSLKDEMALFDQLKQLEKEWVYLTDLGTKNALKKAGMISQEIYNINELLGKHNINEVELSEESTSDMSLKADKYDKFITSFSDVFEQGNSTMSKTFGKATGDLTKLGTNLVQAFAGDVTAIEDIVSMGISKFAELISNGLDELDTMTGYSTFSNSDFRSLAFGYGFNSAQSYGITKAMEITGLKTEEDVYYAIAENGVVGKKFLETFEKYSNKYNKLYDSGTFNKILEYNMEMEEFQQDLKLEVVEFFVDNKDLIKTALDTFMTLSKFLLNLFGKLTGNVSDVFSVYSGLFSSAKADSMINNTTYNKSNVNVRIDNTFKGVEREDKQYLENVGLVIAEPLVKILEGGSV